MSDHDGDVRVAPNVRAAPVIDAGAVQSLGTVLAEQLHREPWKLFVGKLQRYVKAARLAPDRGQRIQLEEVANKIANHQLDASTAMWALHNAADDNGWITLVLQVGCGPDLVMLHNAWVLTEIEATDPFRFERWGEVLHLVPYPIMPFHIKSGRLHEYNEKLYAWARAQATAGAGAERKAKEPDFLVFAKGPAGGSGPYMAVESDPEGRPFINGAPIKAVLDEHQRRHEETVAAFRDLKKQVEETARVTAELRVAQTQPPPQHYQPPAYMPAYPPYAMQYSMPAPYAPQQQAPQQRAPRTGGAAAAQPQPRPASGNNTCSRCGVAGHFARNCTAPAPRGGAAEEIPQ